MSALEQRQLLSCIQLIEDPKKAVAGRMNAESRRLLFHKIFIVKDVRRNMENLEAHLLVALVAAGKCITAMHHGLMRGPMLFMVNYLIDPALRHDLAGLEKYLARLASGLVSARATVFGRPI
jgi:hypothetical protein